MPLAVAFWGDVSSNSFCFCGGASLLSTSYLERNNVLLVMFWSSEMSSGPRGPGGGLLGMAYQQTVKTEARNGKQ